MGLLAASVINDLPTKPVGPGQRSTSFTIQRAFFALTPTK